MKSSFFRADVIGDQASRCPGLMPLHSLISAAAIAVFGCFHNGDGLFAFEDQITKELCPQRVYRTDSGHYMLPIDGFNQPVDSNLKAFMIKHITYRLSSNIKQKQHRQQQKPWKQQSSRNEKSNVFVISCFEFGEEEQEWK